MKTTIIFALLLLSAGLVVAQNQVPQEVNFQAVARDATGALITNTPVEVRVTIYDSNPSGGPATALWCNTYQKNTNNYASFSIRLNGEASPIATTCNGSTATFEEIQWKTEDTWLVVEYREAGAASFSPLSPIRLISIPYTFVSDCSYFADSAIYASVATNVTAANYSTLTQVATTASNADTTNFATETTTTNTTDSLSQLSSYGVNQGDFLLWDTTNQQWLPSDSIPGYWEALDLDGGRDTIGHEGSVELFNLGGTKLSLSAIGGYGVMDLFGNNGGLNVTLRNGGTQNDGYLAFYRGLSPSIESGKGITTQSGYSTYYGSNGFKNLGFRGTTADPDIGMVELFSSSNNGVRAVLEAHGGATTGSGELELDGVNGNFNVTMGPNGGFHGYGRVCARNSSGTALACIEVNTAGVGTATASVKSFHMLHPDDPNKMIWYAAVEGPEAAAYVRGTGKIVNGKTEISFPDHFSTIIDESTLTVHLTPNSLDSKGITVSDQNGNGFGVKELHQGTGTYEFAWEATAERKDQKYFQVIRDARDFYDTEEEHQNAIKSYSERYKKMGVKAAY